MNNKIWWINTHGLGFFIFTYILYFQGLGFFRFPYILYLQSDYLYRTLKAAESYIEMMGQLIH